MSHTLTLQSITPVTHDVNRLVFDKPQGFSFTPGQATELAVQKDGWQDEKRPFTFTSLPEDDVLEFTIKSYPEHDGVTEQIGKLQPGDKVTITDPWGAIEDKGPGVFVAGGAGVTPFISILRDRLKKQGSLEGSTLVFSNKTQRDIILQDEFEAMPGLNCLWVVTDDPDSPLPKGPVDGTLLSTIVAPQNDTCYVCGPDGMVDELSETLESLGVPKERVVHEDFS